MWRDDAYLLDMLNAARKIQSFTQDMSEDEFRKSELHQQAVMRLIQIIGEAARKFQNRTNKHIQRSLGFRSAE